MLKSARCLQITGSSLVKAQIKLAFKTADAKPVLAIRSFQVAQKKATRQFKQIESVLRTINAQGKVRARNSHVCVFHWRFAVSSLAFTRQQQVSLSHRCSDMEKLVPHLMGVSPAVIENVIFCHQEDSNWPLSDSKTLKQRFDDIFAATRYTKALEVIRKLKVEKKKEITCVEDFLPI